MILLPFSATVPQFSTSIDYKTLFNCVRNDYLGALQKYAFKSLPTGFILYKTQHAFGVSIGLVGQTNLAAFDTGKILKHEHILSQRSDEQWQILKERKALVKPVLLTFEHQEKLEVIYNRIIHTPPIADIKEGAERHQLWLIQDEHELQNIQHAMSEIPEVVIADGHHRLASLQRLQKAHPSWDQNFMCMFMSEKHLTIKSFARAVTVGLDLLPAFHDFLYEKLVLEPTEVPQLPKAPHEVLIKMGNHYLFGKWKPSILKNSNGLLDAKLLEKEIFEPFGIQNNTIAYFDGNFGYEAMKKFNAPDAVVFMVAPPTFGEVYGIVKQGSVLPPKSTWFAPRIKNGLTIQTFPFLK